VVPATEATVSSLNISTPFSRKYSATNRARPSGSTRDVTPASGKTIVTLAPVLVSDAASSEPMKPAPMTTTLAPPSVICFNVRKSSSVR